jgi:hypothetical protein
MARYQPKQKQKQAKPISGQFWNRLKEKKSFDKTKSRQLFSATFHRL